MTAPGHMRHPYDLKIVKSGNDLISFFESLSKKIATNKISANVKIDGLNVSFKYVNGQFAVDRGSLKEIDVSGVTINRVKERFGEGHGMIPAITTLLTILNNSLPDIQEEIKELGLIENPHFFLNTEYVTPSINVSSYNSNFIAIHGVNAFYERWTKPTKKDLRENPSLKPRLLRSGLKGGKGSTEVPYSKNAMESLIRKLRFHAEKLNFKVYGPIAARLKNKNTSLDLSCLDREYLSINQSGYESTLSLKEWLEIVGSKPAQYNGSSYDKMLKTSEGKRISPFHKKSYVDVLLGKNVYAIVSSEKDANLLVKGVVFIHATRILGNEILKLMTSELGDLSDETLSHEGVVLRDPELSMCPFKLTGNFIVQSLSGNIAQKINEEKV